MKLYVVTADTYQHGFGSEMSLFGIYTDRQKAQKRVEWCDKKGYYVPEIIEVEADKSCNEYIGGYIE